MNVAGAWAYSYRAIDGQGQVSDVDVGGARDAQDVTTCFRRAIAVTGVAPTEVTTDGAAASPPVLAAVLPEVLHEAGKLP